LTRELHCYLDRFEGDLAVLLIGGRETAVAVSLLPPDAREGDHLLISVAIDRESREHTASEVSELQQELKEGNDRS